MKTLLTIILVAVVAVNVLAQKKLVNKANLWAEQGIKLDTALGAINAAFNDEKTKDWPKTYHTKAMVLQAIYKSDNDEFKELTKDPLLESFDLLKHTYNMEKAGVLIGIIDANLLTLYNQILNEAVNAYKAEDNKKAFRYFKKSLDVRQMEVFGEGVDTSIVFNTALTAQRAGLYNDAIEFYNQSADLGYGEGDTYRLINECYYALGDTAAAVQTLKDGFAKYPEDQSMVLLLLNYYSIEKNDPDMAFEYLKVAKENDPTNAQLYVAEGQLADQIGETEESIEQYKKAIEMDPTLLHAYYNLGAIYFNQGLELIDEANKITYDAKYSEARKVADDKFKEALPYLEKAFELDPNDTDVAETLRTLYYRLGMTEKFKEIEALLQ